ncbi:NIPA-like protein 3 [Yarrowia sp. B02]|nr:NIPA-like protein 3 [Yarrowia sp. B02]
MNYALIGITTAICGNIIISVALNLQRYAHIRLEADSDSPHYTSSKVWWCGLTLMTIGEAGNFLAYAFAPASVVSPLGVFAIVANCLIAPIVFKERVRWSNMLGVGVTVVGILFVVLSATSAQSDTPEEPRDPHAMIMAALQHRSFLVYIACVCVAVVLLLHFSRQQLRQQTALFVYLGLVALFGALTALSTKAVSSLLSFAFLKALYDPLTYACAFVLAATAVFQINFLNRALQTFPSTVVIPTHFVLFTLSVIVGSDMTYHDFDGMSRGQITCFVGGCLVTFGGVTVIARTAPGRPRLQQNPSYSSFSTRSPTPTESLAIPSEVSGLLEVPQDPHHQLAASAPAPHHHPHALRRTRSAHLAFDPIALGGISFFVDSAREWRSQSQNRGERDEP